MGKYSGILMPQRFRRFVCRKCVGLTLLAALSASRRPLLLLPCSCGPGPRWPSDHSTGVAEKVAAACRKVPIPFPYSLLDFLALWG